MKVTGKIRPIFCQPRGAEEVRRIVGHTRGIASEVRIAARFRAGSAEPMTVHGDTVILRQIINFALARDLINRDSLRGLRLTNPKPTSQPCWYVQEVEQILQAARVPRRSQFTILADTGMRVGELKHLTWADIDFASGVIHIQEKPGWWPKTGDMRVIPMTPRVRAILESMNERRTWVFTAAVSGRYPQGDHHLSERLLLEYLKSAKECRPAGARSHLSARIHVCGADERHSRGNGAQMGRPRGSPDQAALHHVADKESQSAMAQLAMEKAKDGTPDEAANDDKGDSK